jgi:hypothetical protein
MKRTLKTEVKHVLFVIAMEAEAAPFLEKMKLSPVNHSYTDLSLKM